MFMFSVSDNVVSSMDTSLQPPDVGSMAGKLVNMQLMKNTTLRFSITQFLSIFHLDIFSGTDSTLPGACSTPLSSSKHTGSDSSPIAGLEQQSTVIDNDAGKSIQYVTFYTQMKSKQVWEILN